MKDILEYKEDELNWTFGEVLLGLIKRPRKTFGYIIKKRTYVILFFIYLFYILLELFEALPNLNGPESWGRFTGRLLATVTASFVVYFIFFFLLKICARLFKGRGTIVNTFKVATVSFIPFHIFFWVVKILDLFKRASYSDEGVSGFVSIAKIFPIDYMSLIIRYSFLGLLLGICVYSLSLFFIGLSVVYKINIGKATLTFLIVIFILFVIPAMIYNAIDVFRLFA